MLRAVTPKALSGTVAMVIVLGASAGGATIALWPSHKPEARIIKAEPLNMMMSGVLVTVGIKVTGAYRNTTDKTQRVRLEVGPNDLSLSPRSVRQVIYAGQRWNWELEFPTRVSMPPTLDTAAEESGRAQAAIDSGFGFTAVEEEPIS